MSEDKLQSDINRAARAKAIINDDVFQEAFRRCEREYMKEWAESDPHESRKREALYTGIQLLADVRRHLGLIMADGSLASAELKLMQEKLKGQRVA